MLVTRDQKRQNQSCHKNQGKIGEENISPVVTHEVKSSVNPRHCYFGGIEPITDPHTENEYPRCITLPKFVYSKTIKSIHVFENIDLIKFLSHSWELQLLINRLLKAERFSQLEAVWFLRVVPTCFVYKIPSIQSKFMFTWGFKCELKLCWSGIFKIFIIKLLFSWSRDLYLLFLYKKKTLSKLTFLSNYWSVYLQSPS